MPDSEKYKIKEEVKEELNTNFNILTGTMRILNRRKFVKNSLAAGVASFISIDSLKVLASANNNHPFDIELKDDNGIIPAPDDPEQWQSWRKALRKWKKMKEQLVELRWKQLRI